MIFFLLRKERPCVNHPTSPGTLPLLNPITTILHIIEHGSAFKTQTHDLLALDLKWWVLLRPSYCCTTLAGGLIFFFFFGYANYVLGCIYMRTNILHIWHCNVYCIVLPMSFISNGSSSKLDNRMESKVVGSRPMRCTCDLIKKHLLWLN